MFCKECGAELNSLYDYCQKCGASINEPQPQRQNGFFCSVNSMPIYQSTQSSSEQSSIQPAMTQRKTLVRRWWFWTLIAAAACITVFFGIRAYSLSHGVASFHNKSLGYNVTLSMPKEKIDALAGEPSSDGTFFEYPDTGFTVAYVNGKSKMLTAVSEDWETVHGISVGDDYATVQAVLGAPGMTSSGYDYYFFNRLSKKTADRTKAFYILAFGQSNGKIDTISTILYSEAMK